MKKQRYALIIIDMQNDFVLPDSPACVAGALATVAQIQKILETCRRIKWPVIHVIREYRADGSDIEITRLPEFREKKYCVPGTAGCEIVAALKPASDEYIIVKKRFSAFMNTELDIILRRLEIENIVICGTQYPHCIRATVYDGVSYGYNVTLITDATAAQTPEIASANTRDIRDIGVECVSTFYFVNNIAVH
ncbi:cysteine hydrolase family protein [candidate division CSSED10-310 bacterium]|uniref:Cysteine hydrolase family protein n=1 Tax=candidate division CSSED10-310 bacterium TaxID=2855610 RepID=A0ABV6YY17_UNCC1